MTSLLLLAAILLVAAGLRFAGLDWDGGYWAHPDERRILMVLGELKWPQPWDWAQVLSPHSSLNPRFFAYGSLPLYLLRLLGALVGSSAPRLYMPGRALSAAFDLVTVAVAYGIGRELGGRRVGLLASAFLAGSVLSIQLAHYLTVESLLTLLATLTVWCLLRVASHGSLGMGLLAGVLSGLALATKTSALPLLCAMWLAWALWTLGSGGVPRLRRGLTGLVLGSGAAGLAFLLAEPYAVLDWFRFTAGLVQEGAMARGAIDLPYTRQFIGTLPYLYTLRELVVWSMGLPLGLLALAGLAWLTWRTLCSNAFSRLRSLCSNVFSRLSNAEAPSSLRSDGGGRAAQAATTKALRSNVFSCSPRREYLVILAWVWPYLLITGGMHAKFSRYMAPLLPWLCLAAALLLQRLWQLAGGRRWARRAVAGLGSAVLLSTFLYALAFTAVYLRPHTWVAASDWICRNVPAGAVLTSEEWDDQLPTARYRAAPAVRYGHEQLRLYAPDDEAKLSELAAALGRADYVVLASQRLYGSIGALPERYPLTTAYYRLLFGGGLGFELVHSEADYPRLGPLAIVDDPFQGTVLEQPDLPRPAPLVLNLGRADESYSVYDRPRVLIFQKVEALSAGELKARIMAAAGMPRLVDTVHNAQTK